MLPLGLCHRFCLYCVLADPRKGFDGLCGLVRLGMKRDPLSCDIYVLVNRRRGPTSGFWCGIAAGLCFTTSVWSRARLRFLSRARRIGRR